eukprot:COSAG02_NODE_2935_length_7705_cov_5.442677_2_plen_336_part_00
MPAEQEQFDFFDKAVRYLQVATDDELCSNAKEYFAFLSEQHAHEAPTCPPTFAVELAWRTHLLTPAAYVKHCAKTCGGLIDHMVLPVSEYPDAIYTTPSGTVLNAPSSQQLDLVGGMRRQQKFMEKMVATRSRLGSAKTVAASIARYARFLNLMKKHRGTILSPTVAIDLVWHTHQMMPARYANEIVALAGRFIDHDDNLEKETLSSTLARTEALWEQAYGEPYLEHGPTASMTLRTKVAQAGLALGLLAAFALVVSPSEQQAVSELLPTAAKSTHRQMQSDNCGVDQYHISTFENSYYSRPPYGTTDVETIIECKRQLHPLLMSSNFARHLRFN